MQLFLCKKLFYSFEIIHRNRSIRPRMKPHPLSFLRPSSFDDFGVEARNWWLNCGSGSIQSSPTVTKMQVCNNNTYITCSENYLPKNCNLTVTTEKDSISVTLTLLAGCLEEHLACKNWVMRCWCGYLSGVRCRLFAHGPTGATAIPETPTSVASFKSRLVLPFWTGLPRLPWKTDR